jgi:aspartate-semialdehyde dehydrogenase
VAGTLALPATVRGRAAIAELGQQVVASFSGQDPPRRVFADGLAFDVLPDEAEAGEWSEGERLAAAEIAALAAFPADRVAVTFGIFPLFAGMVASLHLRGVGLDAAEEALQAAEGLFPAPRSGKLRPRALAGKAAIGWGRLREDPAGDGVHLWVVADNLAGASGAVPVEVARRALAAGLVGGR